MAVSDLWLLSVHSRTCRPSMVMIAPYECTSPPPSLRVLCRINPRCGREQMQKRPGQILCRRDLGETTFGKHLQGIAVQPREEFLAPTRHLISAPLSHISLRG